MSLAALNYSDTISAGIVILGALVTIAAGTFVAFLSRMSKTLNHHEVALAILIQQVNPPGEKSLRELLNDLRLQVATKS